MNESTMTELIDQYAAGYDAVAAALGDISAAELDAREGPGEWSPRQVVHHLADSEMTSAIRLRRLIVEDQPLIQGYDQEEFARRLAYDREIEPSLQAFRYARESTVPLLRRLSIADLKRAGTHSEFDHFDIEEWLAYYATHAHDHADQIRRARATVSS